MIIGLDASRANELKKTGTEWYAFYLIQKFKELADPQDQFVLYSKVPLQEELSQLPVNFKNIVLRWPPKFLWTQIRLSIEMLIKKPDLLFVPAHTIPLIHPKNTVTTLHDVGFERFQELYSKAKIGYHLSFFKWFINFLVRLITFGRYGANEFDYHRFSTRFALKHAKKIITVSEFTKKEIRDLFPKVKEDKIVVIPEAYDEKILNIKPKEEIINETLNKYHIQKPFLLYIGRLEEKKNTPGLIEIFRILKNKYHFNGQLVLLGKTGFNFTQILNKIERYQLDQEVRMPGWLNEKERIILLKSASVFVFPSFYEGFGIPPLEAMAAGIPVVAAKAGAIPEVVGEAAILVNPNEYDKMAESINNVLTNHKLRNELKEKGFKRIKKFNWDETARLTLELIKKVGKNN